MKPPAGLDGVHQLSSPSPPAPQTPSEGAPSASLSRPRERKTSKANLISDLKWSVIDEETEEGENFASVGPDATAAGLKQQQQLPPAASAVALTNLAAAVTSTANLFSTAATAVSNSTSDQEIDINMDSPPYISLDSFIDDPL